MFESFPESYVKTMSFELGQIPHFVRNDSWRGFCTPRKGPLTEFFRNLLVRELGYNSGGKSNKIQTPPTRRGHVMRYRRSVLIAVLASVLIASSLFAQTLTVQVRRGNVRSGPGDTYEVIGKIRRGQKFDVEARQGDWFKILLETV